MASSVHTEPIRTSRNRAATRLNHAFLVASPAWDFATLVAALSRLFSSHAQPASARSISPWPLAFSAPHLIRVWTAWSLFECFSRMGGIESRPVFSPPHSVRKNRLDAQSIFRSGISSPESGMSHRNLRSPQCPWRGRGAKRRRVRGL